MRRRSIILATANPGKLREMRQVLAGLPVRLRGLGELPGIPAPAETGATFAENARLKADFYARETGTWCLADDSGLVVDALAGAPGVLSARFAAEEIPPGTGRGEIDAFNTAKLLRLLADAPGEQRGARFVCCVALADGERTLLEARGTVEGRIAHEPAGENGFGYDPVFVVPELGRTMAQLSSAEKNAISHRGQAVRRFARRLEALLAGRG